jgi:hypothetical protein
MKPYFIREEYSKNTKIIIDGEFDEYIYLIINGTMGITKSVKRIKNLKERFDNNDLLKHVKYIILEKGYVGDIFGIYSALKHQKNNYTVIVLSEKAAVYKISKAHCLYYFGGSSGLIPEVLRGLDTVQQISLHTKLEGLEKSNFSNEFEYIIECSSEEFNEIQNQNLNGIHIILNHYSNNKKIIDETPIENNIKDAWKELENLGSELNEIKQNLLKPKNILAGVNTNKLDLLNKMKNQNEDSCN